MTLIDFTPINSKHFFLFKQNNVVLINSKAGTYSGHNSVTTYIMCTDRDWLSQVSSCFLTKQGNRFVFLIRKREPKRHSRQSKPS